MRRREFLIIDVQLLQDPSVTGRCREEGRDDIVGTEPKRDPADHRTGRQPPRNPDESSSGRRGPTSTPPASPPAPARCSLTDQRQDAAGGHAEGGRRGRRPRDDAGAQHEGNAADATAAPPPRIMTRMPISAQPMAMAMPPIGPVTSAIRSAKFWTKGIVAGTSEGVAGSQDGGGGGGGKELLHL